MLVYDHTLLAEPNLLIPGKKPLGSLRILPEKAGLMFIGDQRLIGPRGGMSLGSWTGTSLSHRPEGEHGIVMDTNNAYYKFIVPELIPLLSSPFTVLVRTYRTSTGGVWGAGRQTPDDRWCGMLSATGNYTFYYDNDTSYSAISATSIGTTQDKWVDVICGHDGTNQFVQNAEVGTAMGSYVTNAHSPYPALTTGELVIGGSSGATPNTSVCYISFILFLAGARTVAEMEPIRSDPFFCLEPA